MLEDYSSARALAELLLGGPLELEMSDYGGFEKVGELPRELPANDEYISVGPGDIILYRGNSFVVCCGENIREFTRLGKMEDAARRELLEAIGPGDVTVTLRIEQEAEYYYG